MNVIFILWICICGGVAHSLSFSLKHPGIYSMTSLVSPWWIHGFYQNCLFLKLMAFVLFGCVCVCVVEFMGFLYGVQVGGEGEDCMVWRLNGAKGIFSVSSFYRALVESVGGLFPWRSIWLAGVPSKVAFFAWMAVLDRILTIDNLVCHQYILVNRCCMYCSDVETTAHFLHCPVAYLLWVWFIRFLAWFGFSNGASRVFCWVGHGVGSGRSIRRLGLWPRCVWCGWFGWSIIGVSFKGWGCLSCLQNRFLVVSYSWVRGGMSWMCFLFLIFWMIFLVRCLVYNVFFASVWCLFLRIVASYLSKIKNKFPNYLKPHWFWSWASP